MRKWITLVMTLLAGCGTYANAAMGEFDIEAGYRRDTIDWRYRVPSNDPFVKTHNQFKALDIFQLGVNGRTTIGYNLYIRGSAYWGWILDGDFRKSVTGYESGGYYSSSSDSFKRAISEDYKSTISDQYVFGANAALGYPFFFCDCTALLAPVIGYGVDQQNCRLDNKDIEFGGSNYSYLESSSSCCGGHCQTFISRWYGPFVGVDFEWRPCNTCFNVWAEVEFHWGNFRGKVSHQEDVFGGGNRHSHNATGWVFAAGADYEMCNCWTLGLSVKFQDWAADRHGHEYSDSSGSSSSSEWRSRENNKWNSYAINLTLGREF